MGRGNRQYIPLCLAGPMEILYNPEYGYISKSFDNYVEYVGLMDCAIKHEIPSDKLEEYSKGFDSSVSAGDSAVS